VITYACFCILGMARMHASCRCSGNHWSQRHTAEAKCAAGTPHVRALTKKRSSMKLKHVNATLANTARKQLHAAHVPLTGQMRTEHIN